MFIPRSYQIAARDATLDALRDNDSTLIHMATGTGKTVTAGLVIQDFVARDKRALFLAHRDVLIRQAYKTFQAFGFETAIEMGSNDALAYVATFGAPDVVVGSVQSLQSDRLLRWAPDFFDLAIIDEAHHALADTYLKTLSHFSSAKRVGITATPSRGDGRNLGSFFSTKAFTYGMAQAIKDMVLCPVTIRVCPLQVDLRGIKTTGGDFNLGELEERIGPMIEQIARVFATEFGSRSAVCFTPDVGSAAFLAETLTALGVPSRYVAGSGGEWGMNRQAANEEMAAFDRAEFQCVVCCEMLKEGWDSPRVEAVGIARPTLQNSSYTQMVGRGTRQSFNTGKYDCLVVDLDYLTDEDSKDLCSSVDLFDDGSVDPEVMATARLIAKERAVDFDPQDIIDEAERICSTRRKFCVRLTGKEPQYAAYELDPVGINKILDLGLKKKYDFDTNSLRPNPATNAQLSKLHSMGVRTLDGLSKWGASKMISKLEKRSKMGLATPGQVQSMMSKGVPPDIARSLKSKDASEAISQLSQTYQLEMFE